MWHYRLTARPGSRGPAVADLRWRLARLGYPVSCGSATWDRELEEAVAAFQAAWGLKPDGIAGPATWQRLYALSDPSGKQHPAPAEQGATPAPALLAGGTGVSPWSPGDERDQAVSLQVSLERRVLILHTRGGKTAVFPVAVGRPESPTPAGSFAVAELIAFPGGPFGTRWIRLKPDGCSLHGTWEPWSVRRASTPGCLRMYNKDVEFVFHRVVPGTRLFIGP
ncbi:MAG: murein L,D-transpeptidase [Firmicutes bacterium]|nr:murein L,D-transpeptidase [Bacillota bacterium]